MKITICGSIAFYAQMEELKKKLESQGHEVLIPLLSNEAPIEMGGGRAVNFGEYLDAHGGMDAFPPTHAVWNLKEAAIRDHYEKIDWCDAVFVANYEKRGIEGYIGGNTLIEIGVAFYLHKKIYILNDVSSALSYRQEIFGMKPIFLKGNPTVV